MLSAFSKPPWFVENLAFHNPIQHQTLDCPVHGGSTPGHNSIDAFRLNPSSQLVIRYHWLAFLLFCYTKKLENSFHIGFRTSRIFCDKKKRFGHIWNRGEGRGRAGVCLQAGREYLADILDRHVSRQAHAKHFRTST